MPRKPAEIELKIDAPGMTPENVDTAMVCRTAASFFELVQRFAKAPGDEPLAILGFELGAGSVRAIARTPDPARARRATRGVARALRGRRPAPVGGEGSLDSFGDFVRSRPAWKFSFSVGGGKSERLVAVATAPRTSRESTSFRATLVRVGGSDPKAHFRAPTEPGEFGVGLGHDPKEAARNLGRHLYRDVDIDVEIVRDEAGRIIDGELLDFHPLEARSVDLDPLREWFQQSTTEWDGVEDIEGVLRDDRS